MIAMRVPLATAVLMLGGGSTTALALDIPKTLVGVWESNIENCDRPEPIYDNQLAIGWKGNEAFIADYSHEAGEGNYCILSSLREQGATVNIEASCSNEETGSEPASFTIEMTAAGDAIAFRNSAESSIGTVAGTYYRCSAANPPVRL